MKLLESIYNRFGALFIFPYFWFGIQIRAEKSGQINKVPEWLYIDYEMQNLRLFGEVTFAKIVNWDIDDFVTFWWLYGVSVRILLDIEL